jgi:Ca2+-binding RTX toxin-like protein
MSGSLFIEAGEAGSFGVPLGAIHLYLVWRESGTGAEYVIRSGPDNPLQPFGGDMRIETNVPMAQSADDRDGATPAERSSTALSFPVSDDAAWSTMVKYCRALDAADYGYNAVRENSNAFVLAMVHAAGGDPAAMLPRGVRPAEVIGYDYWDDIVADVAPPSDAVFRGTAGRDVLSGLQMDEAFGLLGGHDSLWAGRGNDVAFCGAGNDFAIGEDGNDTLRGGDGADRLFGGRGFDMLVGDGGADVLSGGPGSDRLRGGLGADVFEFAGGGIDVVDDFQDGQDRLRINAAGVDAFSDLAVRAVGDALRLDFDGGAVLVHDLDRADFSAADVIFVLQDILTG